MKQGPIELSCAVTVPAFGIPGVVYTAVRFIFRYCFWDDALGECLHRED